MVRLHACHGRRLTRRCGTPWTPHQVQIKLDVRRHQIVELLELFDAVTEWARDREDVVGLALIGSYARDAARPDSDVDLSILSESAGLLIDNQDWTTRFGTPCRVTTEQYGPTVSVRVFYEHGWEVEFGVASPHWARIPLDPGTKRVISDGIRILYDPNGLFGAARDAAA